MFRGSNLKLQRSGMPNGREQGFLQPSVAKDIQSKNEDSVKDQKKKRTPVLEMTDDEKLKYIQSGLPDGFCYEV